VIAAAQKDGECPHLLDGCEAFGWLVFQEHVADDRVARDAMGFRLILDLFLDERRPDIAWTDRVRSHAVLGALECDHLGQPDHAVLSGDIGGFERRGYQPMGGSDVDDAAIAASLHRLEGRLDQMEGRTQVDRQDRIPFGGGKFADRRDMLYACVVDHDVDLAEACNGPFHHHVDSVAVRHVGVVVSDVDVIFLSQGGTLRFDFHRIPEPVQHDGSTVLRQGAGDAEADAAGRAGDDRRPAFQGAAHRKRVGFRFADIEHFGLR
jgi:hypothetical protein